MLRKVLAGASIAGLAVSGLVALSAAPASAACTNAPGAALNLYANRNSTDRRFCIKPMQNIDLHDSRWNFGDKISSIARIGSSCSGYPTFS